MHLYYTFGQMKGVTNAQNSRIIYRRNGSGYSFV